MGVKKEYKGNGTAARLMLEVKNTITIIYLIKHFMNCNLTLWINFFYNKRRLIRSELLF